MSPDQKPRSRSGVQPEERHQVFFFLAELLVVARELIICEKNTLRAVHAVSLLSGSGDAQQLTNLRGMKCLAQTVHGFYNSSRRMMVLLPP